MDEQATTTIYEAPALVKLGDFSEDTLGHTEPIIPDSVNAYDPR